MPGHFGDRALEVRSSRSAAAVTAASTACVKSLDAAVSLLDLHRVDLFAAAAGFDCIAARALLQFAGGELLVDPVFAAGFSRLRCDVDRKQARERERSQQELFHYFLHEAQANAAFFRAINIILMIIELVKNPCSPMIPATSLGKPPASL